MDRYIYVCCSEGCPWWMISTKWSSRRYIDLADWKNGVRSFLGRSKEGVYFAATDDAKLRVWMFTESCDQTGHQSNLSMHGRTNSWFSHEQKYDACAQQLDHRIFSTTYEVSLQQDVCLSTSSRTMKKGRVAAILMSDSSCSIRTRSEVVLLCNEGIYSSGLSFGQLKASIF